MAELVQRRSTVANPLLGLALVAALIGGITGGAVAIVVPAVIQANADQDGAVAA